jgi:2-octaprenyl-6-methoxyphenol hydroxylase
MNVCIVGDGLVSLTLAKALINEGIYVDVFSDQKINRFGQSRTLGISKENVEFLNSNVMDIKKLVWEINQIEIYTEKLKDEKLLKFENNKKELFSIIKNDQLYDSLVLSLAKSKFYKKKKDYKKIFSKNYKLIINCDANSFFSKKYFYKKFDKKYNSYAYTTIINHKKIKKNNTAMQIFTKNGPLAFLPISDSKTSIVYSVRGLNKVNLKELIESYNFKYEITKINQISNFELIAKNLRNYYFQNILAFGELLHKLHPLAGQGFNMSIRDIKLLINLIKYKTDLGLELDSSICVDFEKKIKHKNYLFSNGVDFVYEFFNFESKLKNPILSKSIQFLGKNKSINRFVTKLADSGL